MPITQRSTSGSTASWCPGKKRQCTCCRMPCTTARRCSKACAPMRRRSGAAIFRLRDHTRRLFDSAKIYRINIPFTQEQINARVQREVIVAERPDARRLPAAGRVSRLRRDRRGAEDRRRRSKCRSPRGNGARTSAPPRTEKASMSACRRGSASRPNTIPALAKAAGNYLSSQLIGLEAKRLGFVEGIGLGVDGTVSEGAGENLFLIKDGVLYTPGIAHSLLSGITRDTVMTLAQGHRHRSARDRRFRARCSTSPTSCSSPAPPRKSRRSAPWIAIQIGNGKRGPITRSLQAAFFGLFKARRRTSGAGWTTCDMNRAASRGRRLSAVLEG